MCVYLGPNDMATYGINVEMNMEMPLMNISAGMNRVFLHVDSMADIDLRLTTASGVTLLDYEFTINWNEHALTAYNYSGMDMWFCIDACDESMTVGPYGDGSTYDVPSSNTYSNEWIYIETVNEDLVVSLLGYGAGTGTVSLLMDCPSQCCGCVPWT